MAETRQGTPLPESRQRPDWRTGPEVTRSGKIVDAEILGDTQITTAGDVTISGDVTLTGTTVITEEGWTAPSLQNSWVDYGSGYQGTRYRKDSNGTRHIEGMIKSGTTTAGTLIFTLPAGWRPAAHLWFSIPVSGGTAADMEIRSDGQVIAGAGWSATWTSISVSWAV
jgi:hypothetical protein